MEPKQEQIEVPESGPPSPEGERCEWCSEPATHAVQMKWSTGKGLIAASKYIYACDEHEQLARENAILRKRKRAT